MLTQSYFDQLFDFYPVLLDLPVSLRGALQNEARLFQAPAGHVLFEAGAPCQEFLLVIHGSLRIVQAASQGRELLLNRVQPGEICLLTLSALLQNVNYAARAIVDNELIAASLTRGLFFELVDRSQSFRFYVLRSFSRQMLQFVELVEAVAFGRLPTRLAGLLLTKGTTIKTTHQMLADELGSTREAVSRTLEGFEGEGLLTLERGQIQILDKAGIIRVAGVRDLDH